MLLDDELLFLGVSGDEILFSRHKVEKEDIVEKPETRVKAGRQEADPVLVGGEILVVDEEELDRVFDREEEEAPRRQ